MNPIKDKHGVVIKEGDHVRYYDSTRMWLQGKVIDVGSCLSVETEENPIALYTWPGTYPPYDGRPVEELEIIERTLAEWYRKTRELIYEGERDSPLLRLLDEEDYPPLPDNIVSLGNGIMAIGEGMIEGWRCYEHLEPYINPESAVKCECCGRSR